MDITLERVLSLIPKKENGKFVHGAKKDFAQNIGFKDGSVISTWISGSSDSYKNYLYEIAEKYNVAPEWLLGETDDPTPNDSEVDNKELLKHIVESMSRDELIGFIRLATDTLSRKQ